MALSALIVAGALPAWHNARGETSPPPLVGEEVRRAQSDFAAGGIRKLSANWYACVDQARASQDANAAERCVVYGYGALLLGDTDAGRTPWMRHLTADIMAPGQNEMLAIMGIPAGPRQGWLDRYRRWVSEDYTPDAGSADAPDVDGPRRGGPRNGISHAVLPIANGPQGNGQGGRDGADLARAADGKYPREALQQPEIADALRRLLGPALFPHLKDYSFGSPMEFNGHYTIGMTCVPHDCGASEARYVFSPTDVWVGIVEGQRMRIFGDPPRPVRALLLMDRNQVAWRGAVDDVAHPAPAPLIRVVDNPGTGLGTAPGIIGLATPRMTISPHVTPVSADPLQRAAPESDGTEIRLRMHRGILTVPVLINNTLTVPFAIDSGASDVSISSDIIDKLMASGSMSRADFLGKQTYHLADGSTVQSETFRIHVLKVGDREVRDVIGSMTNDTDSLLLGQSFLTRFRSWSIDNQRQVLSLK